MSRVTSDRIRTIAADCLDSEGFYSQASYVLEYAEQYEALAAAARLALALVKDTWIEDHGNPQVGDAWGALHRALGIGAP